MTNKRERSEEDGKEMEADFEDGKTAESDAEMEEEKPEEKTKTGNSQTDFSTELLAQYYSRLFPFEMLHEWLSYNPDAYSPKAKANSTKTKSKTFTHREFSFTIEPFPGEEIYIRYQSFKDQADLTNAVLKRNPRKIDIGAVFSHPPKDHKAIQGMAKFAPCQRELVFDVDLTDYDGVRRCGCDGANICHKCWKMMGMAMKVMDQGLREDFGFNNIAWFYSGRRGIHAWVCDESARQLSDAGRSAVASYFEVNLGTDKDKNVDIHTPLHPTLSRAHKILEPMFIRDIIPEGKHGILAEEEKWTELLETLPEGAMTVKDKLLKKWSKDYSTAAEKWDELKRYLNILIGKSTDKKVKQNKGITAKDREKIDLWPVATVFRYTYPRLDINVSKMQNHLLKSPFCVHPKTGRVCVPIDCSNVDAFDPFNVPTLGQLMKELDAYDGDNVTNEWEKTSLKESFGKFQQDFLLPMWKDLKRGEKEEAEKMAAVTGDF